jgi:hypothetical protein
VLVQKSNARLKITCALRGYPTTQALQPAGLNYESGLNVLNGLVIGTAIDGSSGALFRYPSQVHIRLATVPPPGKLKAVTSPSHGAAPRIAVTPTPLEPPPMRPKS